MRNYHAPNFGQISNAADWVDSWQVLGPDGVAEDIYGAGWEVAIRLAPVPPGSRFADYGFPVGDAVLTGSTTTGEVTVNDADALQWRFPAAAMRGLSPGRYAVGITATKESETVQLVLGSVQIMQGL